MVVADFLADVGDFRLEEDIVVDTEEIVAAVSLHTRLVGVYSIIAGRPTRYLRGLESVR